MDFFKRLQTKSSETKAGYAFFVALSVTAIVAVVWVSTLPARFSTLTEQTTHSEADTNAFADFLNEVDNQAAALGEMKDDIEETITTSNLDAFNFNPNTSTTSRDETMSTSTENLATTTQEENEPEPPATTTPEITPPQEPRTILIEVKKTETLPVSDEDTQTE